MFIDFHAHLGYHKIYSDLFLEYLFADSAFSISTDKVKVFGKSILTDFDGSRLTSQMSQSGIKKTVLLIIDNGIDAMPTIDEVENIYKIHYQVKCKYPKKIEVFAGIDPRRGINGVNLFYKGISEYNFCGLKLYPPVGVDINDKQFIPYLEICNEHHLPILIHTYPDYIQKKNLSYEIFSNLALKYQNITFILAHAACFLNKELVNLTKFVANIYIDISGFVNLKGNDVSIHYIKDNIEVLSHKILFGTDWPLFNLFTPLNETTQQFNALLKNLTTSRRERKRISFLNAQKILTNIRS